MAEGSSLLATAFISRLLVSAIVLSDLCRLVGSASPSPSTSTAAPPASQLKQQQQRVQTAAGAIVPSCRFTIVGNGNQNSPSLESADISCHGPAGTNVTVVGGSLLQAFSQNFSGTAAGEGPSRADSDCLKVSSLPDKTSTALQVSATAIRSLRNLQAHVQQYAY